MSYLLISYQPTDCRGLAGKTAGGVGFALIFFVTFLYQDKKVKQEQNPCEP